MRRVLCVGGGGGCTATSMSVTPPSCTLKSCCDVGVYVIDIIPHFFLRAGGYWIFVLCECEIVDFLKVMQEVRVGSDSQVHILLMFPDVLSASDLFGKGI